MAEHKPKRHAFADWVNDYWIEASLVVLPVLSAFAAVAYSDEFTSQFIPNTDTRARARVWGIAVFGAIVIAQGIFGYLSLHRVKRISQLEERASQAEGWIQDIFAMCQGHLYVLATRSTLQFEPTDRISLYAHDDKDGSFLLLGRFSLNETCANREGNRIREERVALGELGPTKSIMWPNFLCAEMQVSLRNAKNITSATMSPVNCACSRDSIMDGKYEIKLGIMD